MPVHDASDPMRGPLSHIDLSVGDPDRAIPFYAALLEALGFRRMRVDSADFLGEQPRRAAWFLRYPGGAFFAIEVRPASPGPHAPIDRYTPGLHHMAFHAESRDAVDAVAEKIVAAGGRLLDAPCDYGGQPGYGPGYYAAFFADPDGAKLEVVHEPQSNSGSP